MNRRNALFAVTSLALASIAVPAIAQYARKDPDVTVYASPT